MLLPCAGAAVAALNKRAPCNILKGLALGLAGWAPARADFQLQYEDLSFAEREMDSDEAGSHDADFRDATVNWTAFSVQRSCCIMLVR